MSFSFCTLIISQIADPEGGLMYMYLLQESAMVVISRTGSIYCMRTETTRSKVGNNALFGTRHKFDTSHVKKTCVGFSSLSSDSARRIHISQKRIFTSGGSKRGHTGIVAASPPTEDAVVMAEPLTKKDLIDYLASGCKPKEKWRYCFLNFMLIRFFISYICLVAKVLVH